MAAPLALVALAVAALAASDAAPPQLRRAATLHALQAEFKAGSDAISKRIRAGALKPDAKGDYPEYVALRDSFAPKVRPLIETNPADALGREAIFFALFDLKSRDPALFDWVLKHHLAHRDFWKSTYTATPEFLNAAATQSPAPDNRGWALGTLTRWYQEHERPTEAIATCDRMVADAALAKESGWLNGTWGQWATRKKFELENLQVGRRLPPYTGVGLDGKPMSFADYDGKVTLVVFWATWCGPCLAAIPHERELHKRYAGRPFAIAGVNGDDLDSSFIVLAPDGRKVDMTELAKSRLAKLDLPWRSLKSGRSAGLALAWGVRAWPTVYLIDHAGVIRNVREGVPEGTELDDAVELRVKPAEAKR